MPPRAMLPASWNTWVPRDRSTPSSWYARAPSARIVGTLASVSTLLTTVGLPNSPRAPGSAASRGPCRACPRGSPASRSPRRRCRRRRRPGRAGRSSCPSRARRPRASPAAGDLDGGTHRRDRVGVLRPDVDVALAGTDGVGRDRHALDQHERVALHQHPVGEGAAVALVGVAADELQLVDAVEDGLPLDAGREAGAAATAQAGVGDLGDHVGRRHLQRPPQSGEAAVTDVVLRRQRIDHADPGEGDPILRRQPGQVLDQSEPRRVVGAVEQPGGDQAVDLCRGDGPVADPAVRRHHLDQRLEPQHAARTVADQPNWPLSRSAARTSAAATSSAPTDVAAESRGT